MAGRWLVATCGDPRPCQGAGSTACDASSRNIITALFTRHCWCWRRGFQFSLSRAIGANPDPNQKASHSEQLADRRHRLAVGSRVRGRPQAAPASRCPERDTFGASAGASTDADCICWFGMQRSARWRVLGHEEKDLACQPLQSLIAAEAVFHAPPSRQKPACQGLSFNANLRLANAGSQARRRRARRRTGGMGRCSAAVARGLRHQAHDDREPFAANRRSRCSQHHEKHRRTRQNRLALEAAINPSRQGAVALYPWQLIP